MSKAMQELREYTEGLQTSAQAEAKAAAEQLATATADLEKATAELTAERSKASNIQVALASDLRRLAPGSVSPKFSVELKAARSKAFAVQEILLH